MYFICNSTFTILENLRVLGFGMGSNMGLLDKTKCGRR
jgi:hypothetical protein